jgi:hypothetical protein
VANNLSLVVSRFCAQLLREGYRLQHELVEDTHIVSAYDMDGRAVARYIACPTEDGFCIEELRE